MDSVGSVDCGDIIQAVAVLMAAAGAISIALWQVHQQRKIASRQYTHEMILREEIMGSVWTKMSTTAHSVFDMGRTRWPSLRDDPAGVDSLATTLSFLNYFEAVAVGIQKHAVDEDLYKTWFRSAYVGTWDRAAEFVQWWRDLEDRRRRTAYTKFQKLAGEWRVPNPGTQLTDSDGNCVVGDDAGVPDVVNVSPARGCD